MPVWKKVKSDKKADHLLEEEYEKCIHDIIQHEKVISMKSFMQHGDINCLVHSLFVSYSSYLICRKLGLDYCAAARGGLLHDFFLYDWHQKQEYQGLHGFVHPRIALDNACKYFKLSSREKDIIQKHMWPLTLRLPRYRESLVVLLADKFCALMEITDFGSRKVIGRLRRILEL